MRCRTSPEISRTRRPPPTSGLTRNSRIWWPTTCRVTRSPAASSQARSRPTTSRATTSTFMAINGNGYFIVEKPDAFVDNKPVFDGVNLYTRRGDFQMDKNGYLVNGAGYYLMGVPVDATTGN